MTNMNEIRQQYISDDSEVCISRWNRTLMGFDLSKTVIVKMIIGTVQETDAHL